MTDDDHAGWDTVVDRHRILRCLASVQMEEELNKAKEKLLQSKVQAENLQKALMKQRAIARMERVGAEEKARHEAEEAQKRMELELMEKQLRSAADAERLAAQANQFTMMEEWFNSQKFVLLAQMTERGKSADELAAIVSLLTTALKEQERQMSEVQAAVRKQILTMKVRLNVLDLSNEHLKNRLSLVEKNLALPENEQIKAVLEQTEQQRQEMLKQQAESQELLEKHHATEIKKMKARLKEVENEGAKAEQESMQLREQLERSAEEWSRKLQESENNAAVAAAAAASQEASEQIQMLLDGVRQELAQSEAARGRAEQEARQLSKELDAVKDSIPEHQKAASMKVQERLTRQVSQISLAGTDHMDERTVRETLVDMSKSYSEFVIKSRERLKVNMSDISTALGEEAEVFDPENEAEPPRTWRGLFWIGVAWLGVACCPLCSVPPKRTRAGPFRSAATSGPRLPRSVAHAHARDPHHARMHPHLQTCAYPCSIGRRRDRHGRSAVHHW